MAPIRLLTLAFLGTCLEACSAPKKADGSAPKDRAALEAEDAAAMRGLRRMFPGVRGDMTRETIVAELEREAAEADPSRGVRTDAVRAIQAGEFDRARDLLGELLAGNLLERARAAAQAGEWKAALVSLDHALEVAPRSPSILCLRGEAILALVSTEPDPKLLESARSNFLDAAARDEGPGAARAWLGASRSARVLGRIPDACEDARRGIAASSLSPEDARLLADPLRRALAEATFDDYVAARGGGLPADAIATRARSTRDALEDLLGRTPEEPWPWARLAELAEAERAPAEARDLAAGGLRIVPDDRGLLARLAISSRALGGAAAAVEAFERICREHPGNAPATRELALALYDAALLDSTKGTGPGPRLAAAEAASLRCRSLSAEAGDAALVRASEELAAQCRGALGLWKLSRGDLAGAHTAFLSMEDARKGGIALAIRSSDARGTDGLFRVAAAYGARGELDGLEQAAKICGLLHEVDPEDARFAAESGRFHQEAAIQLELEARKLASQGKAADAERMLARARETMEAAFRALADAARLSPDDERVLARTGEVLGRYLQREATTAIAHLEKAVALGAEKLPGLRARASEPGLADAERQSRRKTLEDEETLVGDACENLGRIHLKLVGDATKAREWLERSRKSGPDPRPDLERVKDEKRWAASAPHGRTP